MKEVKRLEDLEQINTVTVEQTPRFGTPVKRGGAKALALYFDQFDAADSDRRCESDRNALWNSQNGERSGAADCESCTA